MAGGCLCGQMGPDMKGNFWLTSDRDWVSSNHGLGVRGMGGGGMKLIDKYSITYVLIILMGVLNHIVLIQHINHIYTCCVLIF